MQRLHGARKRPRAAPTHPGDRDARGARARGRWGRDRPAGALPDPGTRPCGPPGGQADLIRGAAQRRGPHGSRRSSQPREPGDHPGRRRLPGRPRRGGGVCGRLAGTHRARAPGQGVHRVRQPLRRRDDRPTRVRVRLSRHGALRRAADARHRLPVPAVLPRWCARRPGRRPRRAHRAPRPRRRGAGRHGRGHDRVAHRSLGSRPRPRAPTPHDYALPPNPRAARRARAQPRRPRPDTPSGTRPGHRHRRRRRRGLHRRRRHADAVGRSLPDHERPPTAVGVVQPRLHGQRASASDRGPGLPTRTAGRHALAATAACR